MMWKSCLGVMLMLAAGAVGCSAVRRSAATKPATRPVATTHPIAPEALLALDEIQPRLTLSHAPPATRPAWAPLEALDLYARARNAMLDNRRYTAITFLEKAIVLDPASFELRYVLGRA